MTLRKFNRRSIRLRGHDYSLPGYYFVTICINDRKQNLFGEIMDGALAENDYTKIVHNCWHELAIHYPCIRLDEFAIMPNHVHGIINIRDSVVGAGLSRPNDENINMSKTGRDNPAPTTTGPDNRVWRENPVGRDNRVGRDNPAPTVGKMVAYFKYQSTKQINAIRNTGVMKIWQRDYYDHIIRDKKSLDRKSVV
jgi:putative transposase